MTPPTRLLAALLVLFVLDMLSVHNAAEANGYLELQVFKYYDLVRKASGECCAKPSLIAESLGVCDVSCDNVLEVTLPCYSESPNEDDSICYKKASTPAATIGPFETEPEVIQPGEPVSAIQSHTFPNDSQVIRIPFDGPFEVYEGGR